jgi:transposase
MFMIFLDNLQSSILREILPSKNYLTTHRLKSEWEARMQCWLGVREVEY